MRACVRMRGVILTCACAYVRVRRWGITSGENKKLPPLFKQGTDPQYNIMYLRSVSGVGLGILQINGFFLQENSFF